MSKDGGRMLSAEAGALWAAYVDAERQRVRQESLGALERFIDAARAADAAEVRAWAAAFARESVEGRDRTPVRLPLFRDVLFPALLAGHAAGDAESTWLLSRFGQLLYQSPECARLLPERERSEHGLLLALRRIAPSHARGRDRLLALLADRFDFALHELPSAVLYGMDAASPEGCAEMLDELRFFQDLAAEAGSAEYDELIADARFHVEAYRDYLSSRGDGDTFEAYLQSRAS